MDSNPDKVFDDNQSPVKFQRKSMRGFFRNAQDQNDTLRASTSDAHRMIFNACAWILRRSATDEDEIHEGLREYAATNWASHLTWVWGAKQTEAENLTFVESIASVLINEGDCASRIEAVGNDYQDQLANMTTDFFLKRVSGWAAWASHLDQSKLSLAASTWAKDVAKDMESAMVPLAEGHVQNWLKCSDVKSASRSYRFARSAVLLVFPFSSIQKDWC